MTEAADAIIPNFYLRIKHRELFDFIRLPYTISSTIEWVNAGIATLRTRGGTWKVWITKEGRSRRMCFTHGWRQFVQRNEVRFGVVITFNHTQNLHFNVQVFRRDGSEIVYPPYCTCGLRIENGEIPQQHGPVDTVDLPRWGNKFRFPHTPLRQLTIPDWVDELPGFSERHCLSLIDGDGISWPVSIAREIIEPGNKVKVHLSEGWHQFYVEHGLGVGDVVLFNIQGHCSRDDTSTFHVRIRHFEWKNGTFEVVNV